MPSCAVGKNRSGFCASSSARRALRLPSAARCSSRPLRAAISDVYAAANKPLKRISTRIVTSSQNIIGERVRYYYFTRFVTDHLKLHTHFAHEQFHVLPGLFFKCRAAQQERRMIRAHHSRAAVAVELAAKFPDRHGGPQQVLRGNRTQAADEFGLDQVELAFQVATTVGKLGGQGVAIRGWPAFDHIQD